MAIFDDEPTKPKRVHEIGQDLSLLSVGELDERIVQLRAEIERLEAELRSKGSTKAAAEALFRRS
ncbi:DUF1192 domain-containing protein [Mesorhizobium sp. ZC-5]|uniref:DUF1192 domain-containing protein n=1 Tax=Mesorhizobium sp. ZC-5 TaxID=2986066 RepID=UPI0021E70F92|nr:DUF1192 domain-containing protein [Mesorhizobium sp. ZC-5]MCV3238810.1 DUF1192 domain-containing protein [Mesorhizobium sp. ZC-5]